MGLNHVVHVIVGEGVIIYLIEPSHDVDRKERTFIQVVKGRAATLTPVGRVFQQERPSVYSL